MCDVFKSIQTGNLIKSFLFFWVIFYLSTVFDPYNQGQLSVVLMYFIGILSITFLTGLSGQISLGQGALMAVGGYACALGVLNFGLNYWQSIVFAVLASLIAGWILGITAARLSGPYLAGTTLVIALAIPTLANRYESVLGGDVGLSVDFGNPPEWLMNLMGEVGFEQWQLLATLPFASIALYIALNLFKSRTGRSWRAVRDHEIAASLTGINVQRMKIFTFVIASGFAGLAGAMYGLRGVVGPSVYPISLSLSLLTGAVLGGLRSISGAFIGSALVVFLPDLIEWFTGRWEIASQISNYLPAMVASVLLILTVVINPGGVAGALHHRKARH
jgi:branched-chain amino acid transport system permease protein